MTPPRIVRAALAWTLGAAALGCGTDPYELPALSSFGVVVTKVNGADPPPSADPLPANLGDTIETWSFSIEARNARGLLELFDGAVRLSVRPGAVLAVSGEGAVGRNIRLVQGKASGTVDVTAVYGPARLWVEDVGYAPAAPDATALCEDGDDNDDDVLVDFPNDPGCAFADDDSEEEGTYAAGVSPPVQYALPKVSDIQGRAATTPFPFEGIEVNVAAPQRVIVTRVASDGFYVTDVSGAEVMGGYNSLFAFNFNTPAKMRVCDRVEYLAGTVVEFFGFTELSFPSYRLDFPIEGVDPCEVPVPTLLDDATIGDPVAMEKLESALVRVEGFHVASKFGSGLVKDNVPTAEASSCDLNGDGAVDFTSDTEGSCSNVCAADVECTEWTAFSARGNFKITNGTSQMQLQTGSVAGFDPTASKGKELIAATGTMRNFSGGSLNWTIETRCPDDLACDGEGCVPEAIPSDKACVRLRSADDNDEGTN